MIIDSKSPPKAGSFFDVKEVLRIDFSNIYMGMQVAVLGKSAPNFEIYNQIKG